MKRDFPSSPNPGISTETAWRCMGIFLAFDCLIARRSSISWGSFCGAYLSACEYLWSPKTGQLRPSLKWTRSWCRTPVSGSNSTTAAPAFLFFTYNTRKIIFNKKHLQLGVKHLRTLKWVTALKDFPFALYVALFKECGSCAKTGLSAIRCLSPMLFSQRGILIVPRNKVD